VVQGLLRLELGRRQEIVHRLQGLSILGQVVSQLIFYQRDIRIQLVRLQEDRDRLLLQADLPEHVPVRRVPVRILGVVAQQRLVLARQLLDLPLELRPVEGLSLGGRVRKQGHLVLRNLVKAVLREVLRGGRGRGLGAACRRRQQRRQGDHEGDESYGHGKRGLGSMDSAPEPAFKKSAPAGAGKAT